jgi:dolichol-phosphate mannosyltransferase
MKLSVVIPARDEEGSIEQTIAEIATTLAGERIPFEIVVVDDGSTDQTVACVRRSMERYPGIRLVTNTGRHGFGMAVRVGLAQATGEAIAVMMADGSSRPGSILSEAARRLRLCFWLAIYPGRQDCGLSGAQAGHQPDG